MLLRLTLSTLLALCCACALHASALLWDTTDIYIEMEPEQEEARATFTVTNQGEKTVRIAQIKASCGCTGSIVDKKIITPGESSEIIGTFHKGKRQGLNRNKLQVYLDSEPEPVATLFMNVRIPTLIEAMPQVVYWSQNNSKSARRVRLNLDERYINEVTRVDYDRTKLRVIEELGDPDTQVDRVLVIEPKDYNVLYRGTITIHGSGPNGRTVVTRVHTFVQP